MYMILNDVKIPNDSRVAIEYTIPTTSKRIDFIISGENGENQDSVVIIELKQWQEAEKVEGKDGVVRTVLGGGLRDTHPSYQVWSYAALLENFNETVERDSIYLHPCAYLHNYKFKENDLLKYNIYKFYTDKAPLYGKRDTTKLRDFIKKYIKHGDKTDILYRIDHGRIRPSKKLQDTLYNMLKGNQEFIMIDEQKIAYEKAMNMVRESYIDDEKRVLIVEGGPGTGKSVVAVNLLVDILSKENDMLALYVTKNRAPREVYYSKLKGKDFTQKYIKNLFKSSGLFYKSETNEFDALIVDEAHRLNKKSGLFQNQGEDQIKEIINAARCSVFFIDRNQNVTLKNHGNVELIEKYAKEQHTQIQHIKLKSQFRCNGSDGYLSWLDDVLKIDETANYNYFDSNYDFRVIDDITELKNLIFEKNKINNNARLVAGYCWNWNKEGRDDTNIHDIEIEDFSMSWNLGNTSTWAIDEKSANQVGCIHTCQGLEFDYVGVIIGEDLRYEDGKIITDFEKRAKTDKSLRGIKKLYKENPEKALKTADEIIKNTYKTLMTRGMKGCYIYCVDNELQEYFKERINIINHKVT